MRHDWEFQSIGTLEEKLSGSAKREMVCKNCKTAFADNYHEQCDKTPHPKCAMCDDPADWYRHTQFAGSHPFCDRHAREEDDFGKDSSYEDWDDLRVDR